MSMGWLHPYPYPTGANPRQTSLLTPGYPRTIYVRARSIDVFSSQNRSIDLLFSFVATVILVLLLDFLVGLVPLALVFLSCIHASG
jgi:hypothetical protein